MRKNRVLALAVLLSFTAIAPAFANIFTASDGGWAITVDTERALRDGGGTPTDGLVEWKDSFGYNYVYQDTWFGRDSTATSEGPLSSLVYLGGSNPAPNKILLNLRDNGSLYLDLSYNLSSSGLTSRITENAIFTNNGTEPLTLSIFKYGDYDLTYGYDAHDNDTATGNVFGVRQFDAFSAVSVEPWIGALPNAYQISRAGFPGSVISSLNDSAITNLTNSGSPLMNEDVDFGFQWDFTLQPGQAYTLKNTKILTTTPEPVSCALFLFGGGALFAGRRLRRKK